MNGEYKCNTVTLLESYESPKHLLQCFADVTIEHVYRDANDETNKLAQHVSGYKRLKGEMADYPIEELCIMNAENLDPW